MNKIKQNFKIFMKNTVAQVDHLCLTGLTGRRKLPCQQRSASSTLQPFQPSKKTKTGEEVLVCHKHVVVSIYLYNIKTNKKLSYQIKITHILPIQDAINYSEKLLIQNYSYMSMEQFVKK
jgi:hypothetical protein